VDLPNVQAEMSRGTLQTLVRLPSDSAEDARRGTLSFLDNAVQSGTGTVNLRATIRNADRHFWPGQFVNVQLILSVTRSAVLIPNQATQISQKGPDDTVEFRTVALGQRQDDEVVVTSGVKAGERVVLTGQLALTPGAKVRVP
jgi:multidrug efflux system membrane fusion protein